MTIPYPYPQVSVQSNIDVSKVSVTSVVTSGDLSCDLSRAVLVHCHASIHDVCGLIYAQSGFLNSIEQDESFSVFI